MRLLLLRPQCFWIVWTVEHLFPSLRLLLRRRLHWLQRGTRVLKLQVVLALSQAGARSSRFSWNPRTGKERELTLRRKDSQVGKHLHQQVVLPTASRAASAPARTKGRCRYSPRRCSKRSEGCCSPSGVPKD
eukprot:Rmarinus@m.19373